MLDARQLREFELSHLPDAIHVGFNFFDVTSLREIPVDRNIVVYCSAGYRSEQIARRMADHGYTNVQNLYGGIFEWKNAGLPAFNDEEVTEQVLVFNRIWGVWLRNGQKIHK